MNSSNIEDNINVYKKSVDSVISANILSETDDLFLFELVQTYQIYSHSTSCKKYKNKSCHFNFGKFFTSETIIAQPLKNVSEFERFSILEKRNSIHSNVSEYLNEYLDPSKKVYQSSTIKHVLSKLKISEENYYWALSISTDSHDQVHLKSRTDSCFVNNYNPVLSKAWEANMDLQPV